MTPRSADPDAIAAAIRRVPDVIDLSGGALGEVATYLPGRRLPGVRVTDDCVDVHVDVRGPRPAPEIAASVRAAVRRLAGDRRVDVTVDDIDITTPTEGPS